MLRGLLVVAFAAAAGGYWVTGARGLDPEAVAGLTGDADAGARVFWASGCASCHAAVGASGEDRRVLAGGQRFPSDFGTFVAPNISSDPEHGIGAWTLAEFADAVVRGVSPDGAHYYPAFPYTAYARMRLQDVADLKAYMDTLPADATPSQPHDIGLPFNIRRGVAAWKWLNLSDDWVVADLPDGPAVNGRYLSEALGHCGECHTPRTALGGLDASRWMAGAPNPTGQGRIPNITPAALDWSESDIAYYLETGFTPEFDSVGGHMAAVVANLAQLDDADRRDIAAYLKAIPAISSAD